MKKIKLEEKENITCSNKIVLLDKPSYVYFSLVDNSISLPLVKKGDYVYQEEKIAIRKGSHFPIYSSVSGIVESVDTNTIVIKNDFKNRVREHNIVEHSLASYTKEEVTEVLFQLGISNSEIKDIEPYQILSNLIVYKTLIINALQQEAYLYLESFLLKVERKQVLDLIEAFIDIYNFEEVMIVIPKQQELLADEWKECIKDSKIKMIELEEYYALASTRELIKTIKKINFEKEPSEKGIVVFNVSTMISIYRALKYQRPQIKTIVQFTGNMWKNNCYMEVRIGTSLEEAMKELEFKRAKDVLLLQGGKVGGKIVNINDYIITSKLPIYTSWRVTEKAKKESCIRCGKCIKACPMNLYPVLIIDACTKSKNLNRFKVDRCTDCGLCSYVCPSNIPVHKIVKTAKEKQL